MALPERYQDIDFTPSVTMAENAKKALEEREKKPPSQRGMTSVGLARARDISNRRSMSPQIVREMYAWFRRHEVDRSGSTWKDWGKGRQAWNGWGGDEGYEWAKQRVQQMNAADSKYREEQKANKRMANEPSNNKKVTAYNRDIAMFDVPPNLADAVLEMGNEIDPADLHDFGLETRPHITVLYGLCTYPANLAGLLRDMAPVKVKFGETSLFQKPEFDVVKIEIVDSPELTNLHKILLANFPCDQDYPEYNPHVTIAYVKPGTGQKYVGENALTGTETTLYHLVYGKRADAENLTTSYYIIPIGGVGISGAAGRGAEPGVWGYANYAMRSNGQVESIQRNGREYLRVPVISAQEQVMNDELILGEELGKHVQSWNDSPATIGHPKMNGLPISGRLPEVPKIGRVYNAEMKGKKLACDVFVDVQEAMAVVGGPKLVERLRSNQMTEVSWGWWRDVEPVPGQFQGVRYNGIARNLVPDHLAFLPDEIGACSIANGCGTHRINSEGVSANCASCQCNHPTPPTEVAQNAEPQEVNEPSESLWARITTYVRSLLPSQPMVNEATSPAEQNQPAAEAPEPEVNAQPEQEDFMSNENQNGGAGPTPEQNQEILQAIQALSANMQTKLEGVTATVNAEIASLKTELTTVKGELQSNKQQAEQAERQGYVDLLVANGYAATDLEGFAVNQLKVMAKNSRPAHYGGRSGVAVNQDDSSPDYLPAQGVLMTNDWSGGVNNGK